MRTSSAATLFLCASKGFMSISEIEGFAWTSCARIVRQFIKISVSTAPVPLAPARILLTFVSLIISASSSLLKGGILKEMSFNISVKMPRSRRRAPGRTADLFCSPAAVRFPALIFLDNYPFYFARGCLSFIVRNISVNASLSSRSFNIQPYTPASDLWTISGLNIFMETG